MTFVASLLQEMLKCNRIKNQDTNRTFDLPEFCSRTSGPQVCLGLEGGKSDFWVSKIARVLGC